MVKTNILQTLGTAVDWGNLGYYRVLGVRTEGYWVVQGILKGYLGYWGGWGYLGYYRVLWDTEGYCLGTGWFRDTAGYC